MDAVKRPGRRVAFACSAIAASAAGACALDLSQFDSHMLVDGGRPDTTSNHDAANERQHRDGSPDGSVDGGEACNTPATCGFCAKLHPAPFFCADWDEGPDAAARWTTATAAGGSFSVAQDASVSPPASFLATGREALLQETLPDASTLKSVHIEVDVATTNCSDVGSNYRLIALGCDNVVGAGGSGILVLQDGQLGFRSFSTFQDAGGGKTINLIDGGGFDNPNPNPSMLFPTSSWSHLVLDLTPPYGASATLGRVPDEGSAPAFTGGLQGYGCPHPTTWFVQLGMLAGDPPSCDVHFDNFILDYTTDPASD
jgi:hypothetical protein